MKHFIILGFLALIACEKQSNTTTGNPMVSLSITSSQNSVAVAGLSFKKLFEYLFLPRAMASIPPPATDVAGNSVVLDQGWMVVKEIELEESEIPGAEEAAGGDVKFKGPYVVNLFSAIPDSIGATRVSSSAIRRIKMKLHRLEIAMDNSPSELVGKSLFFRGTIDGKQFSFASEEGSEFQVGGPKPLNVYDNLNLLLSFRLAPIIGKIDFTAVKNQAGPVIISDANKIDGGGNVCPSIDVSATTIYDCFRKALEQQAELGDDRDGSGEIEADEDAVKD